MPAIRQPLRKRCNVQLSVITCVSYNTCDDIVLISKDETPIRGRPQKRQRKVTAKGRKLKSRHSSTPACPKREADIIVPSSLPLPLPLPRSKGTHHLQSYCELIPFLSIALSDGLFDPSTLLPPITSASAIPFTHIIRIQYSTPLLNPGLAWSEFHLRTCISVLNLIVPTLQPGQVEQEQSFLSEHQLLLSRDFLSLALPYYCRSEPPACADEFPSTDVVHVLITAPPGPFLGCMGSSSVVDIMSIVACYLTFVGGEKTATVVECVDSEVNALGSGLADVWKGRIKGDGIEVIQRVAIAP